MNPLDYQQQFSQPVLAWYRKHGRQNLPWQIPRSIYRTWISEIMLQQTQVQTVIPYFQQFMYRFPDVQQLAQAPIDDVLKIWSGLGYYRRAHHLHQTAQIICQTHQGCFPQTLEEWLALPGIGRSTAAAILSQACDQPTAILDGNVKRVLCRYFMIDGPPQQATTLKKLWSLAVDCMPNTHCADYTQAIMDLGATCCTQKQPQCIICPVQSTCQAFKQQQVSAYPHKKIRKKMPVKQQVFWLLHQTKEKKIYLEKRPAAGIWGGLWCLPTALEVGQLSNQVASPMLAFRHTFTHFHLDIEVKTLEWHPRLEKEFPSSWFTYEECQALGLPQPMQKIMHYFWQQQNE